MYNLNWSRSDLTRQKLGTFCEYYAKMSLASYGVSIYTSEVDDHGRDFIADQSLYLFLLLLNDGEHPIEYLIPATTWDNDSSNTFVYHSYEGKKSKPEYGLNISAKNIPQLERFKLENMITAI